MMPATADNRREEARVIEQAQPGWMVIYGIYSKEYVAFPLFHAPPGTIVTAAYPPALITRMQRTEAQISRVTPPRAGSRPASMPPHAPTAWARAGTTKPPKERGPGYDGQPAQHQDRGSGPAIAPVWRTA